MLRLIHNPAVVEPQAYIGTGDMAQKRGPLRTEGTVQTSVMFLSLCTSEYAFVQINVANHAAEMGRAVKEMNDKAGEDIIPEPIMMDFLSPSVPDLVLVDMPGTLVCSVPDGCLDLFYSVQCNDRVCDKIMCAIHVRCHN